MDLLKTKSGLHLPLPLSKGKGHHTVSDWDFMHGAEYRTLSPATFVSPPFSLQFAGSPAYWYSSVLCRIPATLCLPEGEVRTWATKTVQALTPCCFRNQAPLGTSNWHNCYYLYISGITAYLHKVIGGDDDTMDATVISFDISGWSRFRTYWYNGETPAGRAALCVDLYNEIGGEWIKLGETMYDLANVWKDSEINRCGFCPHLRNEWIEYWDDTEIWGLA